MYSHTDSIFRVILNSNTHYLSTQTENKGGNIGNHKENVENILNDNKKYNSFINCMIEQRKRNSKLWVSSIIRLSVRKMSGFHGGQSHNQDSGDKRCTMLFSNKCAKSLNEEKYNLLKYLDDEIKNICDNKILFNHKKENITKTVDAYTNQYSPTLFPKPLKKVTESFVDNGCPLTMSNQ